MDQIDIDSSESGISSCSNITYEGTDGYISDGQDPYFNVPEPEDQSIQTLSEQQLNSQQYEDEEQIRSVSVKSKIFVDHEKIRVERQKKKQVKEIMDELKYGRNTTLLLNKHPLVPTYQQIQKTLSQIKQKLPQKSLEKVIIKLYGQLILKPKEQKKCQILRNRQPPKYFQDPVKREQWLKQRKMTAMAFVDIGYGITKMRKFIEQQEISIEIDVPTYDQIIRLLMLDAYHRLERFLRKKCHKVLRPVVTPVEEKFLLQMLKNCRSKLDKFQIHNFFKLLKMTYTDQQFRLSKRIASRLYHSCQEFIMRKKVKIGLMDPDNPESEIYNNDKAKWTVQMVETAVEIYIKQPSLNHVGQIMTKMFHVEGYLLDNRNIKHHLGIKIKEAIDKLKLCAANQKMKGGSCKIKQMVLLDQTKIEWLLNSIQATNVRVTLCQIYKKQQLTISQLNQAILTVNQFIIKRENEEMIQEMRRTSRQFDLRENQFHRRRRAKRS